MLKLKGTQRVEIYIVGTICVKHYIISTLHSD